MWDETTKSRLCLNWCQSLVKWQQVTLVPGCSESMSIPREMVQKGAADGVHNHNCVFSGNGTDFC